MSGRETSVIPVQSTQSINAETGPKEEATSKPKIRHRCIKQGAILTGHCCISGSLSPWIDPGRRHIVRPLKALAMSMKT